MMHQENGPFLFTVSTAQVCVDLDRLKQIDEKFKGCFRHNPADHVVDRYCRTGTDS